MKMTFKDKIIIYLHNKSERLDNEYLDQVNYYRYRSPDENDYLEMIIKKARRDLCNEIIGDIMVLLNLKRN